MVAAAAVAVVVAVVEVVPQPVQMLEVGQRVAPAAQVGLLVHLRMVLLRFGFVGQLVGGAASRLAFASASRGFDEWLLVRDRTLGNGRPYIDDSD